MTVYHIVSAKIFPAADYKRRTESCYEASSLQGIGSNKYPNSISHSARPEDASKMQKRTRWVLHAGFVEIICNVRGEKEYFFPPFLPVRQCAADTNWSLSNGIQNSDKWLLLQYIGSSLWLCPCPWLLLLETSVHYSLTYNGRVVQHLGYSFSLVCLAKHLDPFYAAYILLFGQAFLKLAGASLVLV